MPADDVDLARLIRRHLDDVFTWLGDCPPDEVDPAAVADLRRGLPAAPAGLPATLGALVDVLWWLDTCGDDVVEPDTAVRLQESVGAYLDNLSGGRRDRLAEVLGDLAAAERHAGRRYEIHFFGYAVGLSDDEPGDAPAVRE